MGLQAKLVIAICSAIILVGSGWQARTWKYSHHELKELNERIAFQTKALNVLADNNAQLQDQKDDAVSALEALRVQEPQTLIRTVYKRVEVPGGATTVDCPVVTAGLEFDGLWNDAARAFNAMPQADRGDGAAEAESLHAAAGVRGFAD